MKKRIVMFLAVFMLVILTACGSTTTDGNSNTENKQTESTQESTETESIEQDVLEIETPEYWLSKVENPDEVLLSLEEIKRHNTTMMLWWGKDWKSGYYDINSFPDSFDRKPLKERIEYPNVKNLSLYCNGKKVTAEEWKEHYKNYNFDKMPDNVAVRYGVIVHSTASYDFPIADIMTGSSLDESENLLQQTYFRMNEPVLVLWESADTEWYYVIANEFVGWIQSKDCALFESKDDWKEFQKQENFLVVTKDSSIKGIDGKVFMSTKLYLAKEEETHGLSNGDYYVKVPQRGADGVLYYTYTTLSKKDSVHEGYLPYTIKNTLTLAFQELGDPYGWGGIDGKRDCSMYIKDIYNCFGFQMPRNSRIQMNFPEIRKKTDSMSEEEKDTFFEATNPGAIMGISGHVMLYLGKDNGQHYVISMLGSYVPETVTENFADHVVSAQSVFVNTLDVRRKNGNTWLQEIISVVDIK